MPMYLMGPWAASGRNVTRNTLSNAKLVAMSTCISPMVVEVLFGVLAGEVVMLLLLLVREAAAGAVGSCKDGVIVF